MSWIFFAVTIGVISSIIQIAGYILYAKKIKIGRVKPNTASWSIWTFGAVLESASYVGVTGDWVKNLLPVACAVSAIVLFIFCLRRGDFGKITNFEWFLVTSDFIAIFIWWYFHSAVYANFLLVLTAIISFVPIMLHVWKDNMKEDSAPWALWTLAYTALAIVVILRWEKWEDLVYPVIFMILHLIIAILALDIRTPRTLKFNRVLS